LKKKLVYVDKTLLIKEFWETGVPVTIITRPRRFGKSLTLSMVKYFFEKTEQSTSYLFENAHIWQYEEYRKLQGTCAVILISFKDIKAVTWEDAYQELQHLLANTVYLTLEPYEEKMEEPYKSRYETLIRKTADSVEFNSSLQFITEVIFKYSRLKTLVLIDEYDTPFFYAYPHKYYTDMKNFISQLLSKALKGNDYLKKCLMTGILSTLKDGMISDLNHPYTLLDAHYSDKFGFTQAETDQLLVYMGHQDKKEEIKYWYNGYVIGSNKVYNPWTVLQYLNYSCIPQSYWVNTGTTDFLEKLIADEKTQKECVLLVGGFSLVKKINRDADEQYEPWSFLLFTGYLTAIQNNAPYYTLAIPNTEIKELFIKLINKVMGSFKTSNCFL